MTKKTSVEPRPYAVFFVCLTKKLTTLAYAGLQINVKRARRIVG